MRIETYKYRLLSRLGQPVGWLDNVVGGDFTGSAGAQVKWAGSVTIRDPELEDTDWHRVLIQPVLQVSGEPDMPLGAYRVLDVDRETDEAGETVTLELADLTSIIADTVVAETFAVPANALVVDAVRQIIESAGEISTAFEPSTERLRSAMVWEPGTSKLTIINELLDAAGYFGLYADRHGVLRLEKYVPPERRPIRHRFMPGETATHLPAMGVTRPIIRANEVIRVSQETADSPALTVTVRNENPDSPYSYQVMKVWVSDFQDGVEATSQAVLAEHAHRALQVAASGAVIQRSMLTSPLALNDVVVADDRRETVENLRVTCTPGALMAVTSRQIGVV